MCVCVQTKEGWPARAPVASELGAMFTYAVLPTLRKHYFDPSVPGLGWQQYEEQCAALAQEMGLAYKYRHKVTLPFYISYDWDPRHTWVREFIATPGRSEAARIACDDAIYAEHLMPTDSPPQEPEDAIDISLALDPVTRDEHRRLVRRRSDAAAALARRSKCYEYFLSHAHVDILLQARFKKSMRDKRFLTVIPEQFMPLSEVSPDIHSPVEHMVKTVKTYVRGKMLDEDLNDDALWNGLTYQSFINEAVAERGNGVAGRKHVSGSVRKQEIICKILAAKRDESFEVMHVFGGPGENKQLRHTVVGTAGGWIKDTKWT